MREILFRGKDIDNPGWIYGFLSVSGDENPSTVIDYQIKNMNCYGQVEVDPETVGQFTGLTDKNGNRAFEHDVIKHHFGDEIGVIRYGEYRNPFGDDNFGGHVGFYVDWVCGEAPGALRKDLGYWVRIAVILGNIHDTRSCWEVRAMATEKRLIDADEFLNRLENTVYDTPTDFGYTPGLIKTVLAQTKTVDAVPVMHGRWVDSNGIRKSRCTSCGVAFGRVMDADCHYCPNCGAKMDLKGE